MTKSLTIADNLSLPLDFLTERIAFVARTGAGKSGGMRVFFEQYLMAGQFAVFLDPKGDAWGIRAAGKGHGFPVLVMGGEHGDVPLQSTAGSFVAEFLVNERVSTVLDMSDFGTSDTWRFVKDFANTLFRKNRDAMHVFIDEADMVAGEKYFDPHCLHAIQLIQNKGRNRGFGVTVATQRTAIINKSILFASGTLVAMQTTAPRDIKIIREWLEVCGTPEAAKEIVSALPTLKVREAIVYSPQSLGPEPKRITFDEFRTFDSMRTPKPGEMRKVPRGIADIDLSAIQRDMAETIEQVKSNDPTELKRQNAELRKQLAAKSPVVDQCAVERAVTERDREWKRAIADHEKIIGGLKGRLEKIGQLAHVNGEETPKSLPVLTAIASPSKVVRAPVQNRAKPSRPVAEAGDTQLNKAERAILTAMYWLRDEDTTPAKVGFYADYSAGSGSFNNALGKLRSSGLLQGWSITPEGESVARSLGSGEKPSGSELREWLRRKLNKAENALLDSLCENHPNRLTADELGAASNYSPGSGSFNNAIGRLRSIEAAVGYERDGGTKAADVFFS